MKLYIPTLESINKSSLTKELNELMYKKKENDETNKDEFNKRVKEAKRKGVFILATKSEE